MRITHVSDCFLPRLGGIETQVAGIAQAQRNHGDDVTVVTATPGPAERHITRLVSQWMLGLPLHHKAYRVIRKELHKQQPAVVHIHFGSVSFFAWSAVRAAKRERIPIVVSVHSMWGPLAQLAYGTAQRLLRWSDGVTLTAVSRVCAVGIESALNTSVHIIHNGVDLSDWVQPSTRDAEPLKLVCATRFAPRKRVGALISMLAQVNKLVGNARTPRLVIAGDGPLLPWIRRRIRAAGLDPFVELPGRLTRDDLKNLYASAHVYIQLSVRESFGIAAVEARAAGLPVIGRSASGFAEFVRNGHSGYLVASDKDAVHWVSQLAMNPPLRQTLLSQSLSEPPTQTWEHIYRQTQAIYLLNQA